MATQFRDFLAQLILSSAGRSDPRETLRYVATRARNGTEPGFSPAQAAAMAAAVQPEEPMARNPNVPSGLDALPMVRQGIAPGAVAPAVGPQAMPPVPMARNPGIPPGALATNFGQQAMPPGITPAAMATAVGPQATPQAPMARMPGITPGGKPYGCPQGLFLTFEANGSGYHVCQDPGSGQQFQVVYQTASG